MKIRAIQQYNEKTLDMKIIEIGDEYETSDERGQLLISGGYAVRVIDRSEENSNTKNNRKVYNPWTRETMQG